MKKGIMPVLLAACAVAQVQQPPPRTGTGVIAGVVINRSTREPIKKVPVTLNGGMLQLYAVTDADGRFAFRGLPGGIFSLNAGRQGFAQVMRANTDNPLSLAAGEEKKGVEISLLPLGSISGRVLDEDGAPLPNCTVFAMQFERNQGAGKLGGRASGVTDDKGEYRMHGLARGRYFVSVRSSANLPAPHALLPRDDPGVTWETYATAFYPGASEPSGAARVSVDAGADVRGIEFKLRRVSAATLRGKIAAADPKAFGDAIVVMLYPRDPLLADLRQNALGVNRQSRTFEIRGVLPGSYWLVAATLDGSTFRARMPLEVGRTPPEPIQLTLAPGFDVKGTILVEGSGNLQLESAHVSLQLQELQYPAQQPAVQVNKDGSFVLSGVVPGRWRLNVAGLPGYVKSATLAGQEISPYGFDIGDGAAGPLEITIGTKMGGMEGSVSGTLPKQRGSVSVVLVPEDQERRGAGLERGINVPDAGGRFSLNDMTPGRYRAFALETSNPWHFVYDLVLSKALASRGALVEISEGGRSEATVPLISAEELERLLENAE